MKHDAPRHENPNPIGYVSPEEIERYILLARRHRNAYLADLVLRGVRSLKRCYSNWIVRRVRGWRRGAVAEAESSTLNNYLLEAAGNSYTDKL